MPPQADNPLQPIVAAWLKAIDAAFTSKQKSFGADAEEGMKFYGQTYEFFWNQMKADRHFRSDDSTGEGAMRFPVPPLNVQVNKVAEFVQLFGPAIFSRNPVRTVTPNTPFTPPGDLYALLGGPQAEPVFMQAQQTAQLEQRQGEARALLMQTWLNYTPAATDLRGAARKAVTEALVKGAGVLWPGVVQAPGNPLKLTGCVYDTIDNLLIDPDAEDLATAKWIARRCVKPQWQVEREYGLAKGALDQAGKSETAGNDSADAPLTNSNINAKPGKSGKQVVYWEVYSKMGLGGRLNGVAPELADLAEPFGEFCKVCVCAGVNYPLNLSDDVLARQPDPANPAHLLEPGPAMPVGGVGPDGLPLPGPPVDPIGPQKQACQWETPYYADGGWPFVMLGFHQRPRSPWPMSHLAPAMGELKFLNWAFGHLASKVRSTSRDFIACLTSAGEEIKTKLLHGGDLTLIEINEAHNKTIDQIVQFLQHPQMNGDIWKVIDAVMELFDKRTGLTELVYGQSGTQMRSGTEARIKGDQMSIRPDDMAESIEAALAVAGRMEALCARYHLTPDDVKGVLGDAGGFWWGQLVYTADPAVIAFNLNYRVEAGTAKKPNKQKDQDNATAMMNQMFPPLYQYGQATGNVAPVNALIEIWGKANDIQDIDAFKLNFPPPMPAGPPAPGGGGPPPSGPGPGPALPVGAGPAAPPSAKGPPR